MKRNENIEEASQWRRNANMKASKMKASAAANEEEKYRRRK
jgi:hypothetical protein